MPIVRRIPKKEAQSIVLPVVDNWLSEAETLFALKTILNNIELRMGRYDFSEGQKGQIENALFTLNSALSQLENTAWRNAFMFGLTQPPKDRQELKKLAYERFLNEGMMIMEHFDPATTESEWTKKAVKQFRRVLRSAFGIKKPKVQVENVS